MIPAMLAVTAAGIPTALLFGAGWAERNRRKMALATALYGALWLGPSAYFISLHW